MHFLLVFLICVLPSTFAEELPSIATLRHHWRSTNSFIRIDTSLNNAIESDENIAYFNKLSQNQTAITLHRFILLVGHTQNFTETVATSLFGQWDCDNNGLIEQTDFDTLFTVFDTNKDRKLFREEFVRADNRMLTIAGAPVEPPPPDSGAPVAA